MTEFRVHPLPTATLDRARAEGAAEVHVATGGEPLRCCLRSAAAGERIMLFSYEPPLPASPYREVGAVYAHAAPCTGPAGTGYPAGWRGRPQVLRAYDARGRIHPATRVHDGRDPEREIIAILADPEVVQIHSRNVAYGCYMFTVTRAPT